MVLITPTAFLRCRGRGSIESGTNDSSVFIVCSSSVPQEIPVGAAGGGFYLGAGEPGSGVGLPRYPLLTKNA